MSEDDESDDDWFERALDDEDGDSEPTAADDMSATPSESDTEEPARPADSFHADSDDGAQW